VSQPSTFEVLPFSFSAKRQLKNLGYAAGRHVVVYFSSLFEITACSILTLLGVTKGIWPIENTIPSVSNGFFGHL